MVELRIEPDVLKRLDLDPKSRQSFQDALTLSEVVEVRWVPTAEELDSHLESHREWLESNRTNHHRPFLPEASLRGADLSGANLKRASLWKADLKEADLSEADLSGANLKGADLSEANFSDADLSEANFSVANLSGANLEHADLSESFLSANLSEAKLSGADLSEAKLWNSDLSGAYLSGTDLTETDLLAADLSEACLQEADFSETKLIDADLTRASLENADLSRVALQGANLSEAKLHGADLTEMSLSGVNFSGANLVGADLRRANLQGANFSRANLHRTDLSEAALDDADFTDVQQLQARQLQGASVSLADLPPEIQEFEGLDIAKAAIQSARRIFILILAGCVYAAVAITLKTGDDVTIELPIVGLSMDTGSFFLLTPVLLALLFVYFHLFKMQRLFENVARLPAIFPDGRALDRKFPPGLITGLLANLVRVNARNLRESPRPSFFPLQRLAGIILGWTAVPVTLGYFAWMYPLESAQGSLFLFILTGLTTSIAITAHRKAVRTFELQDHRPIRLLESRSEGIWIFRTVGFWTGIGCTIVAAVFWYVHLHGPPW